MKWDRNKRMYHISIHALREEGDEQHELSKGYGRHISIHALREEGDWPVSSSMVQM